MRQTQEVANRRNPSNRRLLASLVVLNVLLLGALALSVLTTPTPAMAQATAGRRGDFVMVAGDTSTGREQAVYLLDLRSARLATMVVKSADAELRVIDVRELEDDAQLRLRR